MKKLLLSLAAISLLGGELLAQGYYSIKTVGTTAEYNMNQSTSVTTIVAGTAAAKSGILSEAQALPFTFNFHGNAVSQFKASSSGYITFDVNDTVSIDTNGVLPSVIAPKNAIFAFWDNIRLQNITSGTSTFQSDIRSWTYGTAPSRVFVIQWRLVQTNDGTSQKNVTYFAIRLHEGTDNFDIVENYGFGAFTATIGHQNADGTVGGQITGSPNLNFGGANGSYDAALSDVYTFYAGVQPVNAMKILLNSTPVILSTNNTSGTTVSVKGINMGSAAITSAKMNYSFAGGPAVSANVTASLSASGGVGALNHPNKLVAVAADEGAIRDMSVWLTEINGSTAVSDTFWFTVFINKGVTGTKRVLVEEGSGAWCGYCPDGHFRLHDIINERSNVVGVVHHNSDGMVNNHSNTINNAFATGYPYGVVDRVTFPDEESTGLNRGQWDAYAALRLNTATPVNVDVTDRTYDAASRKVTFKVKASFVDYAMPGDLRLNTYIIENNVRGAKMSATSTQWNQRNYFSAAEGAATSYAALKALPSYVVGYYHQHVVRAIPSTAWGTASVIPTSPAINSDYSQEYTYTVPAQADVTYADADGKISDEHRSTVSGPGINKHYDMKIVAFVSYYNSDLKKHEILNVIEVPLAWNVGLNDDKVSETMKAAVYPNPANGLTAVDFTVSSNSNVEVSIIDITGKKVMDVSKGAYAKGDHSVYFNVSDLNNGIYFVQINGTNSSAVKRLVIAK